jgi:hypothetical protein
MASALLERAKAESRPELAEKIEAMARLFEQLAAKAATRNRS